MSKKKRKDDFESLSHELDEIRAEAEFEYGFGFDVCDGEDDVEAVDCLPLSAFYPKVEEEPAMDASRVEVPHNKKAHAVRTLACRISADYHVKVLEYKDLLAYDPKAACYTPIREPRVFVERALASDARYLTQKDIGDIVQALLSDPRIQVEADKLNANPEMINCRSGILNWKTGHIWEHSPNQLFSYCVDAEYLSPDQRAGCPVFDQFCETSLNGDPEKRQQLLEVIGYVLSDAMDAKSAFFLHGAPDSGKSILLSFISALIDNRLIVNIPLHRLNDKFMSAELLSKKLNVAGEIKGSALRDISVFKSITGSDRICGEFKGKTPFYFTPRCKLLFAGNTLPETTDTDMTRSFVNRLCVVIFSVSIPKEKQDKKLLSKLFNERDEIFSLAVDALQALCERNYQFTQPADTRHFLNAYAETQSSVHAFIKDRCVVGEGGYVFSKDLCEAYREYCLLNGFDPVKGQAMQSMIATLPGVSRDRIRAEGKNLRGFRGIQVQRERNSDGTMEQAPESL